MQANSNSAAVQQRGMQTAECAAEQHVTASKQSLPSAVQKEVTRHNTDATMVLGSDLVVKHGSSVQQHDMQPPERFQSLPPEQVLSKTAKPACTGSELPAETQVQISASHSLREQLRMSYHRPKDKPGGQRDKSPKDPAHEGSRHASRDSSRERTRDESPGQLYTSTDDRRDKSRDGHDKSDDRRERSRDRHDKSRHRHDNKSSHRQQDDHRHASSGHTDRNRHHGSERHDHRNRHVSSRSNSADRLTDKSEHEFQQRASHHDKPRSGQPERKRSRSPHTHRHYTNG